MSNIRLVKKDENHDNIKFGIDQSYYNEVVRRLQNTNVNETVELINSGKYLDSKTLKKHKEKLKQYESDFEFLNEIQKLTSNDYDESSYVETSKWLKDFTKVVNERESFFSKFKNENEFNDAVKIGELYDMPSADIKPYLNTPTEERDALVSRQQELEKQLRELGASGNKGVGAKKKTALAKELNDVKIQINNLDKKNQIAYTTSSGQNITWSNLYKTKKAEEDFNALYDEMSAMPDWEEQSQYITTNKKGTARSNSVFDWDTDWEYEDINKYDLYLTSGGASRDVGYATITTDKEKAIFNYLYHTQGKEAAMNWHKSREDIYKSRVEDEGIQRAVKFAEDYPVLSDAAGVLASVMSGGEFIADAIRGDIGDTNQMAAVSSAIKGTRMEQIDWEVGEWDAFDFLYGTGTSMAESALSMAMFGKAGGIALGLSAAGQSTNDALNRGMSKGQAFTSGVASGIFEGIFESWSIGAFSDLTKNLKRATFRDIAKYVGKNMWNNAKEETLTEIANMTYDYLANGDLSQVETTIRQYMNSGLSESDAKRQVAKELGIQVVEAAGSGALMGFGFGVGGSLKARHNIAKSGKEIKDAGQTRSLVDLSKSLGEGTKSYKAANKITDKSKAFAIGQLLGIAEVDIQSANKGDIVKSLERKGYSTDVANNLAEMMLDPDNTMFENSRGLSAPSQTYNDIINNPNSTVGQRNEALEGILRGVAENRVQKENGKKAKSKPAATETTQGVLPLASNYVEKRTEQLVASGMPIEQAVQVAQGEFAKSQGKMSTQTEKAVESKFESNPEGKDINAENGKIITSKKLVASDKGNMAFEVTYDDGATEKVNANDISFGNEGEALVYSAVMDMNVPVGVAETLIGGYKGNNIKSAGTYVNGVREAFVFGKYNQEADLNNGTYASQLTEEQRNTAFKLGKIYANEKAIADTKAIVGESKPTSLKKREGKLHFEGDKLSLTSVQDVSIENLKVLTMAIGKDIHIFDSYVDKNGKRVYKDANGNIKSAPNGFYDQKDGSVWIDLNAGNRGQGVMMYTVAHELTHFIKQWSPTKFKALADFLVEQYGKNGVSVAELVREQQRKAKEHGRNISYDVAFEEMVADSMESMLTDGKVIKELAKKDKGLFNKIKSWIDNLLRRLNKEYKNYSPESTEGQLILEAKETFTKVQKLFADALANASENYQAGIGQKNIGKEGVFTEISEAFSMRGVVEETPDLLAMHNITEQLLFDVLRRGELISPSIAITNKGHTSFGEISLVFNKNSIDPKTNRKNKLYGADAWTPAQTKLKLNAQFDANSTTSAIENISKYIGEDFASELFDVTPDRFMATIKKHDGSIYEAYAHNLGMQTAYAMKNGLISSIPTLENGGVDHKALEKAIDGQLDKDKIWRDYKLWLNSISDTIITKYDEATNADILKKMKAQPEAAKQFKLSEDGNLTVPTIEYSSVEGLKKIKSRLSENAEAETNALAKEMLMWAKNMGENHGVNRGIVVDAINEAFSNKYNVNGIVESFKEFGITLSQKSASELRNLYKKALQLSVPYFESKPHRTLGLEEISKAIIPSTASAELKSLLEENGVEFVEYENGNNEARLDALNSFDDIKFSARDNTIGERNLEDFAEVKDTEGKTLFQYRAMESDEDIYREMLKTTKVMDDSEIDNLFNTIDKAMDIIKDNLEVLDYAWDTDIDDRAFNPVKPNSDSLYQVSVDFSTLCRKRLLQQAIQVQLQEALDKPLTREEGIAIRDALITIQEEGRQIEVACALCYVESARMKSPTQIKKFLETREKVLKEFFATKSGGDIKGKIKQAEIDVREKLHKENPNGIKGKDGTMLDPRTAPLKAMPKKNADQIRDAKRTAKESYIPTTKEQKLIDVAKGMTISDFTSPEGLENLAKKYPELFDAYTSYIRNATKSKGIEGDTWWRAGDSQSIGDKLIANMNAENGLRSQSWSDFQVIHLLDYMAATIELSTRKAKMQAYTKVPDFVELMGNTGEMINLSLIPTRHFNGVLEFDSVEGMAFEESLRLRDKYHATAGTIAIGIDNKQIQMLLADNKIDYVIPYHKSGMAASIRKLMHIPTWSQYEDYQSEKKLSRDDAKRQAKKYGVKLLAESNANYQKHPNFSDWFDIKEARQIAKMENSNPSDKATAKKYGVMYGGYMAMQNAANNYLKLCAERGLSPKFSHEKADFTVEDNYWKLLIDRKMIDNVTGEVIEQQSVKPIFDQGEVLRILNDELERYPSVKADQDYATRKVAENFLSGNIKGGMSAEAIAKAMKKPVDNVAKVNILASVEDSKLSDRDSEGKTLSKEQQEFFKDSKVRDAKGNLKVMYHGTKKNFTIFDDSKLDDGLGFFFTEDKKEASDYGVPMSVYLNITNPFDMYGDIPMENFLGNSPKYIDGHYNWDAVKKGLVDAGYDGLYSFSHGTEWYVAFNSNQIKLTTNTDPTSDPDIRYSDRDYSYDSLLSKPNMPITSVNDKITYKPTSTIRKTIVNQAIKNASSFGKLNENGNVVIHVDDIDTDVVLSKNSLTHGLDRRLEVSAPVILNVGSILKNSIRINELTPKKQSAIGSYVLIGYAESTDYAYPVRMVVNQYTNEVDTIDVLYAVNTKKETVGKMPGSHGKTALPTVSNIRIADLLEFVNKHFSDVLPESVLKHYGHTERPKGELGESALYSERDTDSVSTRSLLANALEGTALKPEEKNLLRNYKTNLRLIDSEQAKLDKVRQEYKEIAYKKSLSIGEDKLSIAEFEKKAKDLAEEKGQDADAIKFKLDRNNGKYIAYIGDVVKGQILSANKTFRTEEDTEKLKNLSQEAKLITTRINSYDRELFKLETMKPLKDVLAREKELARKRQKEKDAENLRAYKEKVAETTRQLLEKNRQSREKAVEGRNKTEMRHKVKKVVNDLNNLLLKPTKERHIPEEMRIAVAEALDIVNMDTVDAETRVAHYNDLIAKANNPDVIASLTETRDRILNQGNKLAEKLAKLKDAYAMINASADESLKSMYDDVIYSKIESVQKKVGRTPLRNMTLEQLESVYELYKMVLTTVRDSNKAFAEDLKMTRQALGSNTFAEIKNNNKERDRIKFEGIEKFGWKNLKPMQAMKTIGSSILQQLWNNILYGQEVFAQDYDEAVKFAKETKEKYGYNKWNLDKLYPFESKSGKVMKINLEQMMSIYAYSKRKQADEHIEKGGILLNESIIKEKKFGRTVEVKVNDSTAYRLDKMQVNEIIATLEKKFPGAKDFVDEMQKYLSETMGEKGNEVAMKMYGIKLFKEEHYFPLKSSKDFMESANAKLKGDVKIKNKGMTKATVEHASNPIVLEGFLDVWANHINEMSMYHGLVLPLEDFSRTLNYSFKADDKANVDAESVRTALRSVFGESADNYLNELLKAINGGVLHDSSTEFADKMISKFKKAKVMASLSVIVQQPTAIIRAMGIIEPKYFVAQNFNHKQTWEELKKYCPTAIIKETGSFDTNMGRTIVDMVKEDRKFTEKVGDALGKAPAWMDEMGWNMIWRALKKKVAAEQNLSGEALLQECGKRMTLIINETQVYDSVMSRNELMRSKSALTKMATAFMGEPSTVANMIYGATLDFKRGKKGMASKTVAAVISSVIVNGLVSSLVYAFRDDDEEKTWLEKYLSSSTTEIIEGLNPLTYIPWVKDAYSLAQGYDVERTDLALIGDVKDAIDDFYNVLDPEAYEGMSRKEIAKHIYENSIPLLTSICDMFGLPVGNILRDAEAIIVNDNLSISKTSGEGTGLAIKEGWLNASPEGLEKFFGDEKYHKLYLIANNGDTAYVKTEVAEMVADKVASGKTEKGAKQSVKSSFTSVYRDEYKKAYKKKDSQEMNRIRKLLYATGLWNSLTELDSLLADWRKAD